jgi:type VI secretion system protein ImpJ
MPKRTKTVWQDSMFMYPQHLQQQDAYFESLINDHQHLQPYYWWGIIELELDQSYLKLNKLSITKCVGIFPNGMLFNIPDRDKAPEPLDIPSDCTELAVYIAVNIRDSYNLNYKPGSSAQQFKYNAIEENLPDITSLNADNVKTIITGQLNLNLFIGESVPSYMVKLPIAKIIRKTDGITIDESYVPPMLRLKPSDLLIQYQDRVLGILNGYIVSSVMNKDDELNKTQSLLILQTVIRFKYSIELISKDQFAMPYDLFKEFVLLFSSLIIFADFNLERQIPVEYDHLNIAGSFEAICELIFSAANSIKKHKSEIITLYLNEEGVYIAELPKLGDLEKYELVLGIELVNNTPDIRKYMMNSLKIASQADIMNVVNLQVPGIDFTIINNLPFYAQHNENILYIRLSNSGSLWSEVIINRSIAIYFNPEITEVFSMKLWLVSN